MTYEMERPNWNPNLVVPGTGYVNAGYAEQQAAGISYTDNAHMVHYKLAQHRAAESAKFYANLNAKPATVAKPVSYPYVAPAKARNVGTRTAAVASPFPMATVTKKKAAPVVGRLVRHAMSVLGYVLRNFPGIIFFAVLVLMVSYPDINYILRHTVGAVPVRLAAFGAVLVNVLWLLFKLARATGRGLKKVGIVKTAKGTMVDKDGKLAVNL